MPAGRFWALTVVGAVGFVFLWSAMAASGWMPRTFLPAPWEILERLVQLTREPFAGHTLQIHLVSSLQRFAMGFILAVCVGIPLGLLMAWFRWIDKIVGPLFEAVRFVAPIAWVPFAALWFGTGIGGPVLIIFMGALPPVLINTYRGAKYVDRKYIEASSMLGAGPWRGITQVMLPAAVPSIVSGLRISAGLAWQSLVGAELIVASSGVGYLMVKGQAGLSTATVMSGMIAIGIVGLVIDVLLRRVQQFIETRRGL
ncbi:ABC transporter permease [Curvibacter delicatus]|uniref:ABC transporter permease n=1 Tax=Curvibacter delicatus TaxID=80879 RepID=UPI0034E1DB36